MESTLQRRIDAACYCITRYYNSTIALQGTHCVLKISGLHVFIKGLLVENTQQIIQSAPVLIDILLYYRVLIDILLYYWVLIDIPLYYWVQIDILLYYRVLIDILLYYWGTH